MNRFFARFQIAGLLLLLGSPVFAQSLSNVAITPSNSVAGAFTIYTASFQTSLAGNGVDSGIPLDGKIILNFPAGFDLSGVEIAFNQSGLDGGYSLINISGQKITLTRDGTGTALVAGASAVIKLASIGNHTVAANTYTVAVETQTSTGVTIDGPTTSAAFNITAGALDRFIFAPVANQVAGQNFSVTLTAKDAYDNDVNHSGTVTLSDNTGTLTASALVFSNQPTQTITDANITLAQSGVFLTATGSGKTAISSFFTVTPSSLDHLRIVEGSSGPGANLGARTMTTDETLALHAAGYDAFENYITDVAVDWTVSGGIGAVNPQISSNKTTFSANTPGSGAITAVHATATNATSGTITVQLGAPHHIKIMNNLAGNTSEVTTAGLTTNDQLPVHASSFDSDDNYIADVSVSWSVSGGIGTLDTPTGTSTTLTATAAGSGQITASHATLIGDATGTITVSAGTVFFIKIVEGLSGDGLELGDRTLTADQTLTVHAAGYDAAGNYVGDQTVTWGSTGSLDPAVSATATTITFNPKLAPTSGTITATHATATGDNSGTITVGVGSEHHVKIMSDAAGNTSEVTTAGLTPGDALIVHASSFDTDDNYVTDVSVTWSLSGGIGSLAPASGISTTFTAQTAGTGQINASHATLLGDATGTISVNAGALAYIKIVEGPSGDGPELGLKALTADEDLIVHAAGYDAGNNYLGDQTVTWTSTGTLAPAVSGSGPSMRFAPTAAPASGTLIAEHATATGDTSGTISVTVGVEYRVKVMSGVSGNTSEVQTVGLTTGQLFTVHASSFDADDNYIGDVTVDWSVSGGIGTLSPLQGVSTILDPTTVGSGQITADHPTLIDDATGSITVTSGTLAFVKIVEGLSGDGPELGARSLTADAGLTVHAAGYDAGGNYLSDQTVTWGSTGTLAPALSGQSTSITFNPTTAPASGTITATHATATGDQTGTITVSEGSPFRVKVLSGASGNTAEVGISAMQTDEILVVHASSFDSDDNYLGDISVDWSVSGGIGILSPTTGVSTTLTAKTPGSGQISATHATLIDDATGTITVTSGSLAYVKIVEGPSGDGPELGARTLTSDDQLTVHAAGYDAANNYLGDQAVTWSSTGTLTPALAGSGTSVTFTPTLAPASGTIAATHATATDDATGIITVNLGAPHHVKVLSAGSGNTSEVVTASLVTGDKLAVHAGSFDAKDNYVADVSVDWSVSGGIGSLAPASGVSTTLTATTPGSGQITAIHATLIDDATGAITVTLGALKFIKIVEGASGDGPELGARTLTADDQLVVHAAGYDSVGNYLGDETVTWGSTGNLSPAPGGSSISIVFSPDLAPASGTITAAHATATGDASGTITVNVGAAQHLRVLSGLSGNTPEVGDTGMTVGDSLTVHAGSFDAKGNYVADVSVDWSVSGGIGTLSPVTGVATKLAATTPGTGQITATHATLISDATGTISVNSGSLAYVKIVEGPSGDGPELDTRTLSTDDQLAVHAAGYDAAGNYLGDQTVTWSSTGTLAPALSGTGPSIVFSPNLAPTSGTITATHATAAGDGTGQITVNVGAAHHLKVMSGAAGNTSEVATTGLTTGDQLVLHASSFDADDNYVADVSVGWSVSGGIGTLSQPTGVSTTLTATTPGTGQITATHATLIDDATGTIIVNSGSLNYVKIIAGVSGDGPELDTHTLSTDDQLTVHAAGYDSAGNYLGDQTVTWSSTGTLAPAVSGSGTSITFSPNQAPATGSIVATHATATDDATGTITVNVGVEHHVKVMSALSGNTSEVTTAGLTTGDQFMVHASSFDADNNYIADVSVDWSISGGIGTLAPATGVSSTLTATTPGSGQITASHASLIDDATGAITVNSGTLFFVKIVEGPSGDGPEFNSKAMTTDETLVLHAAGYDSVGNYIGDQTVIWASTGNLTPSLSGSGTSVTFAPSLAPASGTIIASHPTATDDVTGTITVDVGKERYISVLNGNAGNTTVVDNVLLTTSQTLTVHASSFDAKGNYVADVSVNWSLSANIGTLTPTQGISTILEATTAGSAVIIADHATLIDDATGTITVTAGNLSYVKIVAGPGGDGPPLGAQNLTTDDDLVVHAAGYDGNDNYLGDQTVAWAVTNGIGVVDPLIGTSTRLRLTTAGAGQLIADHPLALDDTSGVITVSPGGLSRVQVLVGSSGETPPVGATSLSTDQTLIVHAGGFDAGGNYISDVIVDWRVSGGIGAVTPTNGISTTFDAQRLGSGQIIADHATAIDGQSGSITVTAGVLAFIRIAEGSSGDGPALGARTLTADQTLSLHAAGFDADTNYVGDQVVDWSSTGTLEPAVTGSGASFLFEPTVAPAAGTIRATHATVGSAETGAITVNVGALHHLVVLSGGSGNSAPVGATSMNPGDALPLHAGGFDADNNYISDITANWSVIGPIGNISPASGISATFTAQTVGEGNIRAAVGGNILDGFSGKITVSTGSVAKIIIRTQPGGAGVPFADYEMTTDNEVTVYAAGYDAGDNYFGDVNVTWSSTGNLSPAASGSGSSFTFSPVSGDAGRSVNGQLVAEFSPGISDSTGTITVLPGQPVGDITLTPNPTGLPANGTATSTITSAAINDAENNPVGPGVLFNVTIAPAALGSITTPDADPGTPGHQVQTNAASQLVFTFQAGNVGGIAAITVTSGLAASGQTQITLGSLSIVSISTAPETVSRSQSGIAVNMTVQNLGSSSITDLTANLLMTGTADRTGEYSITPSPTNPTVLGPNVTVSLTFNVDVSATATAEAVSVDGSVTGIINGSTPVSSTGAASADSWTVQYPAALALQSVSTPPDTVAQGQTNLTVTVRVANNLGQAGTANALIDSVKLKFAQGPVDRTSDYVVAVNPANPTSVLGNSFVDLTFTVNVGLSASIGLTSIDAEVYGRDANTNQPLSDLNATVADAWEVVEGNAFSIVAMIPTQATVTANMLKEWQIRMQVQNSGSSAIALDLDPISTGLRLNLGSTEVTSEYTISFPAALDEGGTTLIAGSTGHLTYRITKTGASTGIITVSGFAAGTDISTGLPISDNTNDSGTGEFRVESPGALSIDLVEPSKNTVTAGRTADWTVTATVRNTGGSAIKLTPPISFSIGDDVGYVTLLPQTFTDGDSIIGGNESKQLQVVIDQTGTTPGTQAIGLQIPGIEMNSDRSLFSNTGSSQVLVQTPAALQIVDIRASQATVTAGQTNPWTITMLVRNTGESPVTVKTDTSTNMRVRLGTQIQPDYNIVLQPATWLGTSSLLLAGNAVDSLRFVVNTTGANSGFIRLVGTVSTVETNSDTTLTANLSSGPIVQVQTGASITYIDSSMVPDVVNNNSFYTFRVRVRNAGEAVVQLEPAITVFSFDDGSNIFSAALDANKVISIGPGDTTLTFQSTQVPAAMLQQTYTPSIELRGTVNGTGYAQTLSVNASELLVAEPASVQIVSLEPSQATVTRQMTKPWNITMVVANNGGTTIVLDSLDLSLFNGGLVTPEYSIEKPLDFAGSGTTLLAGGQVDSLVFRVTQTGIREGATSIQGRLWVVDQSNQETIFVQTEAGAGSFVVQSPAVLRITGIAPSQPTVTRGQVQVWSVDVAVQNAGGSTVKIDFNPDSSGIAFSLETGNDYSVIYPDTLVGGDSLLVGNSSGILRFFVTQAGAQVGNSVITGQVTGVELNSDSRRFDDTADGGQGSVLVQTPALLRVKSVVSTDAPNLPFVNTSQGFKVKVAVENLGQETADSVRVALVTAGQSAIQQSPLLIAAGVAGGSADTLTFSVTASSSENPAEIFTGSITSAIARNTGLTVPVDPALDDTTLTVVQLPADLQITTVMPSQPSVAAEQNIPWSIYVLVRNNGGASLQLDTPAREDIEIKIGGVLQQDYVIAPPQALSSRGDLLLPSGVADTLAYRVTSTGRQGGQADIVATLDGTDRNTLQALSDQNLGSIAVESAAAVRIVRTDPVVNYFLSGTEIGLVNTGQSFAVKVRVENAGFEDLQDVVVQLTTDGASQVVEDSVKFASIPSRASREAVMQVTAATTPTLEGQNETFSMSIIRATGALSQEPATVFLAADSIAQVRVQLPAKMNLSAVIDDDDGILSTNQVFEVTTEVANTGQADVDEQGRVAIDLPPNFELVYPSPTDFEQAFQPGTAVIWRVRASDVATNQAVMWVRISRFPNDRNTLTPAIAEQDSQKIVLKVVQFDLSITKVSIIEPEGAKDDTLSTGQQFTLEARVAFSEDLGGQPRSLTLVPADGYNLLTPARIDNFSDTETWRVSAPAQSHGERWFKVIAEGSTGTGDPRQAVDSLAVVLVSRALLDLQALISSPEGARDGTLTLGQDLVIRANLGNLGTAATVDTAMVRLETGASGIQTDEPLEKIIDVNGFVEWQATAPDVPSQGSVTVRIIRRPFDENNNLEADIVAEISTFDTRTDSSGRLSVSTPVIVGPSGALDRILSTGQDFTISASLDWNSLANVSATLELPVGFFTENASRNFTESNGPAEPQWIVRAPEQAAVAQQIRVRVQATDANNNDLVVTETSDSLQVEVVQKAVLRLNGTISAPPGATDGIVSISQPFEVTAAIDKRGDAAVFGSDSIRIFLPEGYSTTEPLVKSSVNNMVTWNLVAKATPSAGFDAIRLLLQKRPFDENTGKEADVEVEEVTISIQTEPKQLEVRQLPARESGPTAANETDVALMRLSLENLGKEGSNDILLRGLTLILTNSQGEDIAPNEAIRRMSVVTADAGQTLLGEQTSIPAANPVTVNFSLVDTLIAGVPREIDILVDIAAQPKASEFQLRILSSEDFEAVDAGSGQPVQVVDETGATGEAFQMQSATSVLTEAAFENFYNYPNPFRPGKDAGMGTYFYYYLPGNSQVELKIFTLLGELVYEATYDANSPQGQAGAHTKDLSWDGYNGDGKLVLNGVYVAILKIASGTVTTKIAVAK